MVESAVPVPRGASILLTHREAVNDAWDLPKSATMGPFLERYPEFSHLGDVSRPFEWKWYYAMQEVGDQRVEALSMFYRSARARRDELATWFSALSFPALVQRSLERLANTDTKASLAYEQSVRAFHAELRRFYYPKLFGAEAIDAAVIAQRPEFQAAHK